MSRNFCHKFPSDVTLIDNATLLLHRTSATQFDVYLEAEDPQTGEPLLLRMPGAVAQPIAGDMGREIAAQIARAEQKMEERAAAAGGVG